MSEIRYCSYCGKSFIKNGKRIFCSDTCRKLAHNPKRHPTLEESIRISRHERMTYGQATKAGLF